MVKMIQKEYIYRRIPIKPTTAAHLHKMKQYGESYDELINRLLKENKKLKRIDVNYPEKE
jgi:predicted CopG family antitoxin